MGPVLLSNDDGVFAEGLQTLFKFISDICETYIVAPDRERSASGRSLTIHRPLKITEVGDKMYSVSGTPTDSVAIAIAKVLPEKPALVISGINHGPNLGDDIMYSGTVSAAMEGTMFDIPSMAVSLDINGSGPSLFESAARVATELSAFILDNSLPYDTLLNVNVPNLPFEDIKGRRFTRQGKRKYEGAIHDTKSPWGENYYWIGGGTPTWDRGEENDINTVREGYVSITPLHMDLTNYNTVEFLSGQWRKWGSKKPES
jgi:5'-nucleotidase